MRYRILLLLMLLFVAPATHAQVSIGINFSLFPDLVQVPNYPVYYAPRQNANYFFYDGMYWVYQNDEWYSSDWYNGPWYRVAPAYVPLYVLRVPVRYYRRPPPYFHGWRRDAPPRWGDHWGRDWEQHRSGWDKWDRKTAPRPAPLPTYQRQYSGNRYPGPEERHAIHDKKYRYQPRDAMVREHVRPEVRGTATTSARDTRPEPRKDAGKDGRDRDQRKDSGKDSRDRDQRKDAGKDTRDRDQRPVPASTPPAPKSAAPVQPPAARERPTEPPRKDAGRETRERERDQRPPSQPATPREPPPPRPAAPPPPPPKPAAPPPKPHPAPAGKGPEKKGEEHNK